MDTALDTRITRFYRRWHQLEAGLGAHKGLVIDFDMAPAPDDSGSTRPFHDRSEALVECTALVNLLATFLPGQSGFQAPEAPANPSYTFTKLSGSLAYLWALTGERRSFDDYLAATMGIRAHRISPADLSRRKLEAATICAENGIPWSPEGGAILRGRLGRGGLHGFEAELRSAATEEVSRLRLLLPDLPEPDYTIEVVREDAYWCNWIDGTRQSGVVLRVNTHPRHDYMTTSARALAAHEIAGHAAHVTTLTQSMERGLVDPSSLNLTVHACDAFQMEGLAQVALHILTEIGPGAAPLPSAHRIMEALRDLAGDRMGNAQLDVEAGLPMQQVWKGLEDDLPLSGSMSLRASLRDRSRSPLHRSYIHVYAPSKRMFSRLLARPVAERAPIVRALYEELWTPGQLALLIDGHPREQVRQQHVPPPIA